MRISTTWRKVSMKISQLQFWKRYTHNRTHFSKRVVMVAYAGGVGAVPLSRNIVNRRIKTTQEATSETNQTQKANENTSTANKKESTEIQKQSATVEQKNDSAYLTKENLMIGAAVLAGGISTVVLTPVVLTAIGFGANGVVPSSVAALTHSAIGNVAAGSPFALLQSAGATGTVTATSKLVAIITCGIASGGCTSLWASSSVAKNDPSEEENNS